MLSPFLATVMGLDLVQFCNYSMTTLGDDSHSNINTQWFGIKQDSIYLKLKMLRMKRLLYKSQRYKRPRPIRSRPAMHEQSDCEKSTFFCRSPCDAAREACSKECQCSEGFPCIAAVALCGLGKQTQ